MLYTYNVTAQNNSCNNKGECSFQFTKRLFTIRTNTVRFEIFVPIENRNE